MFTINRFIKYLACVFTIIPIITAGYVVGFYSANVPFEDSWGFLDRIQRLVQGNLAVLTFQCNDSRPACLTLYYYALSCLAGWNCYVINFNQLLFMIVNLFACRLILSRSHRALPFLWIWLSVVSVLIFSLAQWRTLTWDVGLGQMFPTFMLILAIAVVSINKNAWVIVSVCWIAAAVSAGTFVSGLLVGFSISPLLFYRLYGVDKLKWRILSLGYILGLIAIYVVFFTGYSFYNPQEISSPRAGELRKNPAGAFLYFVELLGSPFAIDSCEPFDKATYILGPYTPIIYGILSVSLGIFSTLYMLKNSDREESVLAILPWLCIATYPLACAMLTTFGRFDLSPIAVVPRYIQHYLPLHVAVFCSSVSSLWLWSNRCTLQKQQYLLLACIFLICTVYGLSGIAASVKNIESVRNYYAYQKTVRAYTMLSQVLPEEAFARHFAMSASAIHSLKNANESGILRLPLWDTSHWQYCESDKSLAKGSVECDVSDDGKVVISGSSRICWRNTAPELILIGMRENDSNIVELFAAERAEAHPYHGRYLKRRQWEIRVDPSKVQESIQLSAWALDGLTGKIYRFGSNFTIPNQADAVKIVRKRLLVRLYHIILNRNPSDAEINAWIYSIEASQLSVSAIVAAFFASPEQSSRTLPDSDYVKLLYMTLLKREADDGGMKTWMDRLGSGVKRSDIIKGITTSKEFSATLKALQIKE